MHNKEAFVVVDANDLILKDILAFLVPIVSPSRPDRVTKKVASTIILSWLGKYKVDWAHLIFQAITKHSDRMKPKADSYITSYLAHVYKCMKLLMAEEEAQYELECTRTLYGYVTLDEGQEYEEELDSNSDVDLLKEGRKPEGSPTQLVPSPSGTGPKRSVRGLPKSRTRRVDSKPTTRGGSVDQDHPIPDSLQEHTKVYDKSWKSFADRSFRVSGQMEDIAKFLKCDEEDVYATVWKLANQSQGGQAMEKLKKERRRCYL